VVAAEYVLRLLARGTHDYSRFIAPSELARDARKSGLEIIDLTGLHYNPITRHYWLGDNTDVNYLMATYRSPTSA
jgi:2-polyprenyl-6-hydroxyphenyl methylase/3-demethylubiquinone-9 3-methyltransferase